MMCFSDFMYVSQIFEILHHNTHDCGCHLLGSMTITRILGLENMKVVLCHCEVG